MKNGCFFYPNKVRGVNKFGKEKIFLAVHVYKGGKEYSFEDFLTENLKNLLV